ncbi:MAG: hypothetical protein HKN79_01955 [Flavobacteriales bacterium]|nr:hypothetical protein [Flavobacteriales bacterium]
MRKIAPLVIGMTVFVFFFAMTPILGMEYGFINALFLIGNVMVIYMVYAVLRFGEAPKEKFDDGYWYSDIDRSFTADESEA